MTPCGGAVKSTCILGEETKAQRGKATWQRPHSPQQRSAYPPRLWGVGTSEATRTMWRELPFHTMVLLGKARPQGRGEVAKPYPCHLQSCSNNCTPFNCEWIIVAGLLCSESLPTCNSWICLFWPTHTFLQLKNEKRKIGHHGLTRDITPKLSWNLCFDIRVFFFLIGWSSSLGWTLKRGSRALETKWTRWSCPGVPESIASSTSGFLLSWWR